MDVVLLAVGAPKRPGMREAIAEYEERTARYFRYRAIQVAAAGKASPTESARLEGEALLKRVPAGLELLAVTRRGEPMSTRQLADYLDELGTYGRPGAAFLIGGAGGLSEEVLVAAPRHVSLSSFTLPHELARVVLTEQLYRAGTILRGEPYHKGR